MDQNNNLVPLNDIITDDCIPASLIFQDEAAYCLQDTLITYGIFRTLKK